MGEQISGGSGVTTRSLDTQRVAGFGEGEAPEERPGGEGSIKK